MKAHTYHAIGIGMLTVGYIKEQKILSSFARLNYLNSELEMNNDRVSDILIWEKELKSLSEHRLSSIQLLRKVEFENKLKLLKNKYTL